MVDGTTDKIADTSAALIALNLHDIPVPPPDDRAAIATPGTLALGEVQHVASAMQLPAAQLLRAYGAVETATGEGSSATGLWALAISGCVGDVEQARAWMQRVAARSGLCCRKLT